MNDHYSCACVAVFHSRCQCRCYCHCHLATGSVIGSVVGIAVGSAVGSAGTRLFNNRSPVAWLAAPVELGKSMRKRVNIAQYQESKAFDLILESREVPKGSDER